MALPINDLKNPHGWTLCFLFEWPARVIKYSKNGQYKAMKPCLYDYCPLQCVWHYWGEFGSGFLVSALCTIPGCCSSPLLSRLSKPAPQPVLAWCSKPRTSCPSFSPLSKFLISFFEPKTKLPSVPLPLYTYENIYLDISWGLSYFVFCRVESLK